MNQLAFIFADTDGVKPSLWLLLLLMSIMCTFFWSIPSHLRSGFLQRVLQVGKKLEEGAYKHSYRLCTPLQAPPLRDSSNICWLAD